MWTKSLSITTQEEGGILKAHTDLSPETPRMQLQKKNIVIVLEVTNAALTETTTTTKHTCRSQLLMEKVVLCQFISGEIREHTI